MPDPVLSIRELVVEIPTRFATLCPVDRVSYDIAPGEILGVVGESGAGKSMAGNAVIGLLTPPAHIAGGEIWLGGERIDTLSREALRRKRGKEIGMVFQDPLTSLNPLLPIGEQLTETILEHLDVSQAEARARAVAALEEVGIPAAASRAGGPRPSRPASNHVKKPAARKCNTACTASPGPGSSHAKMARLTG